MRKKFVASTGFELVKMVREVMGPDAVIISTRTIQRKGKKDAPYIEVTAELKSESQVDRDVERKRAETFCIPAGKQKSEKSRGIEPSRRIPKVIAFASGKVGTGGTNMVVNLGHALAKMKKKILVFDANLSLGGIDVLLGKTPKFNLYHVLSGKKEMEEIMINGPGGMKIIPAPSGIQEMSQLRSGQKIFLSQEFERLSESFDAILLDTGPGISANVSYFCSLAREVAIVVTPDPALITNAHALIRVLYKENKTKTFNIIVNLARDEKEANTVHRRLNLLVKKSSKKIDLHYLGYIPQSSSIQKATRQQKAFLEISPRSKIAKNFSDIAKQIL